MIQRFPLKAKSFEADKSSFADAINDNEML